MNFICLFHCTITSRVIVHGRAFNGVKFATSEFQCWLNCVSNEACKYYTWYSLDNEDISNECFEFDSCDTVNQCNEGCYTSKVHCEEPTTITSDTTTKGR